MPSLLDILGYAGNVLDLPGSSLRDLLSGNNPFDQWATPLSSDNRASGRDVLQPFLGANEETGMSGWLDNPMEGVKDLAGFGFEMAADPLNFVSMAPVFRALKGRKAAKTANKAERAASKGRYGFVNTRVVADDMLGVPQSAVPAAVENPMGSVPGFQEIQDYEYAKYWAPPEYQDYNPLTRRYSFDRFKETAPEGQKLLGYTPAPEDPRFPGREVVHHGGHYWGDSATPQHPYGMMDLDRIHTGEGNTVKGPGGYVADDVRTTDRYYDMVANQAPGPEPKALAGLYAKLDEIFAPGAEIDMRAPRGPDSPFLNIGNGDRYWSEKSLEGMEHVSTRVKGPKDALGYPLENTYVDPYSGGKVVVQSVYNPGLSELDWQYELLGGPIPLAETKPTRYTLDAPAGTKARMMDWEGGFAAQPTAVQDLIENHPTERVLDELDSLGQEASSIRKQIDAVKKQYGINSFTATPDDPAELLQLREKLKATNALTEAKKMEAVGIFGSEYEFWKHSNGASTGEKMADMLMGKHPSQAKFEDVTGLLNAGVPGMKNLATSTGKTSYNYAIWDKDLWSQMRVRAIDEQPVPINPMFGPVKAGQRIIPQIAEPSLLETINPMSLQPLPGLAKPAMQGAAYQALARFNSYGGSL